MGRITGFGVKKVGKGMGGFKMRRSCLGERYWELTKAESIARQGHCGRGVEGGQGVFV